MSVILFASWLQNEVAQMTLNTTQVLEQQQGWNMRCHYVHVIFTFSLSRSPFLSLYSSFKLLNLLFVKARKMNNSINYKSHSWAFYSGKESISWDIGTTMIKTGMSFVLPYQMEIGINQVSNGISA